MSRSEEFAAGHGQDVDHVPLKVFRTFGDTQEDGGWHRPHVEELKRSIAAEGLREPIEVVHNDPRWPGTNIFNGHHRAQAIKELGTVDPVPVRWMYGIKP